MRGLDGALGRWSILLVLLLGLFSRLLLVLRVETPDSAASVEWLSLCLVAVALLFLMRGGFGLACLLVSGASFGTLPLGWQLLLVPLGQISFGCWSIASMLLLGAWIAALSPVASPVSGAGAAGSAKTSFFTGFLPWSQALSGLLGVFATPFGALSALFGCALTLSLSIALVVSPVSASPRSEDSLFQSPPRPADTPGFVERWSDRLPEAWRPSWSRSQPALDETEATDEQETERAAERPSPPAARPSWRPPASHPPAPVAPVPTPQLPPTPPPPLTAATPAAAAALDVLRAYYRDLNSGDFQANRYFAPQVTRFISMRGTTTTAIDRYIHHVFPKQFKEHHFELEEGSLEPEGPRTFTYVEKASYFFVAKKRHQSMRTQVRVEFDASWKLLVLHQFKVLR